MKILVFVGLFVFVICGPIRAEWVSVHNFDGSQFKGHLEYNPDSKSVKLFYKRKRNWGDFIPYGPFQVATPTDVDESVASLSEFLKRQLFSEESRRTILNRVEEFKFITSVGCQAVYFESVATKEKGIEDLVEKISLVTKSSDLSKVTGEALRSLVLEEFKVNGETIQLRMILDGEDNFLKLSFAKPTGDLEGYKVSLNHKGVTLFSPNSQELISVDSRSFDNTKGFLEVNSLETSSVLGHSKTLIKLQKNQEDWNIDAKGLSAFERTVIKEGVALTSTIAEHESVIQLEDSDVAFSRMDSDKFKELEFLQGEADELMVEKYFNICMAEQLSIVLRRGGMINSEGIQDETINFCHKRAVLESINEKVSNPKKTRQCLIKKGAINSQVGEFLVMSGNSLEEMTNKANECWRELKLNPNSISDDVIERIKNNENYEAILKIYQSDCDGCSEKAQSLANYVLLKDFLTLETSQENDRDCFKAESSKEVRTCAFEFYLENVVEALVSRVSEELTSEIIESNNIAEELSQCLNAHIVDEPSIQSLLDRDSFYRENCYNEALKPYARRKVVNSILGDFSDHGFLFGESEDKLFQDFVGKIVHQNIQSKGIVRFDSQTIERLKNEIVPLVLPEFLTLVKEHQLSQLDDNLVIDTIIQKNKDTLSHEINLIFERTLRDSSSVTLKKNLNAMGQGLLLKRGEVHTRLGLSEKVLIEEEREELGNIVNKDYQGCLSEFSPTQSYPLFRYWLECEKKRLTALALVLAKREYENIVSQSFPLSSPMANDILSPMTFFQRCMERKQRDPTVGAEEFKNHTYACRRLTEFDLSFNLSLAKQDEYLPLLKDGDDYRDELKACYREVLDSIDVVDVDIETGRENRSVFALKEALSRRSLYGSSLLSVFVPSLNNEPEFRENDRHNVDALIASFRESDEEQVETWKSKLIECEKKSELDVGSAFREYMIDRLPSLEISEHGEQYEKVMRDFLDAEMVDLILSLKDKLNTRGSSVLALKNFVDTLSDLIDNGFVYDEGATRTELIVFKNEFKSFLRWAKRNPNGITLEDASDFFKESKLSEHLSLAVLSQKVFENFENGLHEMKQKELGDLYRSAGCRTIESYSCLDDNEKITYDRITNKYKRLLEHTKTMTSSYDFRRIMRPDSPHGREVLARIRELYLRPKILGTGVSQRSEEEVMKLVGEEILKDNTEGGFADLFVQEAAQYQLDIEKDKRWAITEFFFFDNKDFDWDTLKKTEAGQRAIAYYSRYIMLPRFLGQKQSRTTLRIRKEQFRRLLTTAQGQNSL